MPSARQTAYRDIRVKVTSAAKKDLLKEISSGKFAISVKQEAAQGRANARVREMVAEYYQVQIASVMLIKGASVANKIIRVYGGD